MTPNELAKELGVTGTAVRTYLRELHPRSPKLWGKSWHLDNDLADKVRERFKRPFGRASSRDEMATLSVAIPEVLHSRLGAIATREHRSLNDIVREAVHDWLARTDAASREAVMKYWARMDERGDQ